jgi:isopropylmalate/homocitrate/citramalate synthase
MMGKKNSEVRARERSRVEVIDCTLRDGEQTPGVWFTISEKLELAALLDGAGVDVLDAGFPGSGAEEVETLQALRQSGRVGASIGATARAVRGDVVAAERARAQEVFLFLPTSDLRLVGLGLSRSEAAKRVRTCAEEVLARGMGLNVVAEDAYRSDPCWLVELWESMHDLPMRRLVVCDTVGAALPQRMTELFALLRPRIDRGVALCAHCHNDFGMATANTIAAVMGGATVVTCTVNGIGERAGNADLAETTAGLTHLLDLDHGVRPEALGPLSSAVQRMSGVHTSPLKPVTGTNVYRHESGVHVDGMLQDARSYEALPAAWTGQSSGFVLGKHSGTSLLRHLLQAEGLELDDTALRGLLAEVKDWSRAREKSHHGRILDELTRFRERALGGIPFADVVARARELAADVLPEARVTGT